MPHIVDYSEVVEQACRDGLVSLYPNSGAFGFAADIGTHSIGWIGSEDPTIRPAARHLTKTVATPAPQTLARLATRAWRELLPGPLWLLPKAHWAYELDFGSASWMPALLDATGVDSRTLAGRHDGTAIAFAPGETEPLERLLGGFLGHLLGSDFQLLLPSQPVVCTVHHHQQLWWTSNQQPLIEALRHLAD